LLWTTLTLGVLILIAFQLYINREPARIQAVRAADQAAAIAAGEELYQDNCASCHGEQGEGEDAPALNNLAVLRDTLDQTLFDLTANGIPSTEMPPWSQPLGGPFTDEEIRQIVAFIRSWEPTAPDLGQLRMRVDVRRGAQIYVATCAVCHGKNGRGGSALALNDRARLQQFDNKWYAETIAKGKLAKGMPRWGAVLSPQQIGDLVALFDAWRRGE
jgi:mono/diheme cytochrome c family protein